jgi:hypothetical protein
MAAKRKHTELLTEEKRLLCEYKKKNPRIGQEQLAGWCQTQFGKTPGRSTIGGVLQNSEKYLNSNSTASIPTRDRDPLYPKLEAALILWLNASISIGVF